MTWLYGEDYGYAMSRLEGTVVKHGGLPVIVLGITNNGVAKLCKLSDNNPFIAKAVDLDCTPVTLGYVNRDGYSLYASRVPARRYRQGLSEVTLSCIKNGGVRCDPVPLRELNDCILGLFKPYAECVRCDKAMAWHRDWASSKDKLYYKGGLVGKTDQNGRPVLAPQYRYLQEALDEDCNAMV
jgi:hypothetical protein